MNKSELIAAMALKAGLTKVQAKNALEALLDTSKDALKKGEKIALIGFGTFSVLSRKPERVTTPPPASPSRFLQRRLSNSNPAPLLQR